MPTRRAFLTAAAAPAVLRGRRYSGIEIERMLERGDVRGKIGKEDLPTPALLVDLDAFEANVTRMAEHLKRHGLAFRPHGKTHKCGEIARRLLRAGAVGCCAAKISEAEAFAREGVTGLLITAPVIGRHKIDRAIRLARQRPDTIFCADDARNVRELHEAARAAGLRLNLAIDLYVGRRTGVAPGEPALRLAELISSSRNLRLVGLQAYAGHASHAVGFEKRRQVSREAMQQAVETRRLLEARGIPCPWLSGGSTGTYNIDVEIPGITELQPGSFIFMDIDYNRIGGKTGDFYGDFQNSLTVLATVISKPAADTAIIDAGLKAFSTDRPFVPECRTREGITYSWAGDEHGRLTLSGAAAALDVGDRLEFVVPHCDPTVNLYDRMYAVRGQAVEAVWRISARGMSQ